MASLNTLQSPDCDWRDKGTTMQTNKQVTRVVFRAWRTQGDILALFPDVVADVAGRYVVSYEHIGQHGQADYLGCISRTRPAKPTEYMELKRELESIGYQLRIVRRK